MKDMLRKIILIIFMCFMTHSFSYAYDFNFKMYSDELIYKSSIFRINSIDPGVGGNSLTNGFPGGRGANQLVIYTPEFGKRTTGTNEFGMEAIVVNGYVTSLSGADSLIPKNGFVISGHGSAKEWINKNISIGSKIVVDKYSMTITSFLTPDSYVFEAEAKIKEVYSIMKYYAYKNIPYDYTESVEYLKKSQKALMRAAKQKETSKKHSSVAIQNADKAIKHSIPYYENELKGVWIRPTEKTPSEIANTLQELKEAGINNVFLETYYHAKTIYPSAVLSKYGIVNQRQEFVGFDPLAVWIREAHKRGIKLNIWFECFYVGNDKPEINPKHILSVYPQWANKTRATYDMKTLTYSPNEHNGYFLDPANPMVQDFLLEVLDEILTKYEPDGINLDYIRYPQTADKISSSYENSSWGYTQYARSDFMFDYEIDPVNIQKNTPEWNLWASYRQNKVSDFVRQAGELIREKGNGAKVTAVIFPDRQRSLDTKMQDWKTWSYKNYIDGFTPLLLSCDYDTAKGLLNDIKVNSSPYTDIYSGIFVSFMNGSTDDMLRQIHMSRELNSKGVIIFDYSHFSQKYMDAVSQSAFTPLSEKTKRKIVSKEISQNKLQNYLDKAVKDFYMEEIVISELMNRKQERKAEKYEKMEQAEKISKKKILREIKRKRKTQKHFI